MKQIMVAPSLLKVENYASEHGWPIGIRRFCKKSSLEVWNDEAPRWRNFLIYKKKDEFVLLEVNDSWELGKFACNRYSVGGIMNFLKFWFPEV